MDLAPTLAVKLRSVRHYNGLPIDARSVTEGILSQEKAEQHGDETVSTRRPRRRTALDLDLTSYRGSKTTLCAGCGHNAISSASSTRSSRWASSRSVLKLSGIGCSSKSPAYFLDPSTASTPSTAACRRSRRARCSPIAAMLAIGVSGDGDTGAIGIGQFVHLMRRNLPLIYIIEDNGVLRPHQGPVLARRPTSARRPKNGVVNDLPPIDTCALAIELGASFVARSFSGDKKQLAVGPQGRHRASRARR